MSVILIAAVSENGVIGRDGDLPWHLPKDLKRFKKLTTGHTVVMGRKTFDSCDRKPLPNRRNIVITRNQNLKSDGVEVVHSLDEALSLTRSTDSVFIVGGSAIYEMALPLANTMELTRVHATLTGHVHFPKFENKEWRLVSSETHQADEKHDFSFTFQRFERV